MKNSKALKLLNCVLDQSDLYYGGVYKKKHVHKKKKKKKKKKLYYIDSYGNIQYNYSYKPKIRISPSFKNTMRRYKRNYKFCKKNLREKNLKVTYKNKGRKSGFSVRGLVASGINIKKRRPYSSNNYSLSSSKKYFHLNKGKNRRSYSSRYRRPNTTNCVRGKKRVSLTQCDFPFNDIYSKPIFLNEKNCEYYKKPLINKPPLPPPTPSSNGMINNSSDKKKKRPNTSNNILYKGNHYLYNYLLNNNSNNSNRVIVIPNGSNKYDRRRRIKKSRIDMIKSNRRRLSSVELMNNRKVNYRKLLMDKKRNSIKSIRWLKNMKKNI